jgi:hypothetical protein
VLLLPRFRVLLARLRVLLARLRGPLRPVAGAAAVAVVVVLGGGMVQRRHRCCHRQLTRCSSGRLILPLSPRFWTRLTRGSCSSYSSPLRDGWPSLVTSRMRRLRWRTRLLSCTRMPSGCFAPLLSYRSRPSARGGWSAPLSFTTLCRRCARPRTELLV